MNNKLLILLLLFLFTICAANQCQKCSTAPLFLGESKSWLPLKGKTSLGFVDTSGNPFSFELRVEDTTGVSTNDCGDAFQYEYILATLYLNSTKTDSLHFSLTSGGWLCARGQSNSTPAIAVCGDPRFGSDSAFVKLVNHTVGSHTYPEMILLKRNPGSQDIIDSVFLAKETGPAGFKYGGVWYVLP